VKIAIVAITDKGRQIAQSLRRGFYADEVSCFYPACGRLKNLTLEIFDRQRFEGIIFIMALGIVVRLIARYLKDKYRDPAIVAVDEAMHFAIAVLCGHEGGANDLAVRTANILGAEPVITMASQSKKDVLIGIGCRRGIKKEEVISGIRRTLAGKRISFKKVKYIATIDLKKDEPGLRKACMELGIPLRIIAKDLVKRFTGKYEKSLFVHRKIGLWGVCQPCALLAGRNTKLIFPRLKLKGLALAIAREC
jgi:cobalt-precorrin 5A hydrolase